MVNSTRLVLKYVLLLQIIFVMLISVFLVILYSGRTSSSSEMEKEVFTYQSLEYYPETEEFAFGIVSQFEEIGAEFISTFDENGKNLLLSNLGSEEYICTGRCSCESGSTYNRRNSAVLPRRLIYLVASVTALFAYNRAEEYFKDECETQLTNEGCPIHSVQSSIEGCDGVHDRLNEGEEEEEEVDHGKKYPKFICWGNCVFNEDMLEEIDFEYLKTDEQTFWKEKIEFCRNLRLETEVLSFFGKPSDVEGAELLEAKSTFQFRELDPFCRKEGKIDPHKMGKIFKDLDPKEGERWSWCQGSGVHSVDDGELIQPELECRRVR